MRIYGNRLLKTLPGRETRPTTARVREALFNIWQGSIQNCRWLDLCAGNGSMGAEALCRGAATVVGIEQSGKACHIIRQNWEKVATPEQEFRLLRGDVRSVLPSLAGEEFDRIYFDPPYASGLYEPVLEAIARYHLLAPAGELAIEHDSQWSAIATFPLTISRQKRYGNTNLTFYENLYEQNESE